VHMPLNTFLVDTWGAIELSAEKMLAWCTKGAVIQN
jgi:hypothetical protein